MFTSFRMMEVMLARFPRCFVRCCKNWDTRSNRSIMGHKCRMKASNPCGISKSTSSPPSLSEEFLRSRRSMQPSLQDAPSMLEFMMLPAKPTWSLIRAIANSWMERNILTFPNELVDLPTSMWSMYLIQGTLSLRSMWILPLHSPRSWTPQLRKWNSGRRSMRRQ
jgi:hypothetical protein